MPADSATPPTPDPSPTVPPQPAPPSIALPDPPLPPAGPFTAHAAIATAKGGTMSLKKQSFTGFYSSIRHDDPAAVIDLLELEDIDCNGVGTLFENAVDCAIGQATLRRIRSTSNKNGRPFLRFRGPCGSILLEDVDVLFEPTPNTRTGDIATGVQFGGKAIGETLEHATVNRMRVQGIFTNWPAGKYWNGDGVTAEKSLKFLDIGHLTVIDATDGAVDLKCKSNIGFLYAQRARAALKLWDDAMIARLVALDMKIQGGIGGFSVLRIMGNADRPPVIQIPNAYIASDAPLIRIETGPAVIHGQGHFEGPKLIDLSNGGSLAPESTWNGSAIK